MTDTNRMRQIGLNAFLWSAFAGLILIGAYVVLNACDFSIHPLFGSASCHAPVANAALESEQAKEAQLQSRIHAAEIHLALLPPCPKPLPQPLPQPLPVKVPEAPPEANPAPVQAFEIPKKIEDLKGCWQSARGDIDIVNDDAERKVVGQARICYCFKTNGRGRVQIRYTDGDLCLANLTARISPDQVFMHHELVACRRHGSHVAADIRCNNSTNQTICEIDNIGQTRWKATEQFIRVSDERCGWNG